MVSSSPSSLPSQTRGFTFVTSGKKRETLQGDATVRFYDHLNSFGDFNGIMANLFTGRRRTELGGMLGAVPLEEVLDGMKRLQVARGKQRHHARARICVRML